jgi:hypothetical protein
MRRIKICTCLISILMGCVFLPFPFHSGEAKATPGLLQRCAVSEDEISTYSSFIEKYVNEHWKKADQPDSHYEVTLLEITKRERIEQLKGQYNYCLVLIEYAGEIRECVACFWQPDTPDPGRPFDFRGIHELSRKAVM